MGYSNALIAPYARSNDGCTESQFCGSSDVARADNAHALGDIDGVETTASGNILWQRRASELQCLKNTAPITLSLDNRKRWTDRSSTTEKIPAIAPCNLKFAT